MLEEEHRAGTPEEAWAQVVTRLNLEIGINNITLKLLKFTHIYVPHQ